MTFVHLDKAPSISETKLHFTIGLDKTDPQPKTPDDTSDTLTSYHNIVQVGAELIILELTSIIFSSDALAESFFSCNWAYIYK